jgi:predicted nucleic-acid-binding protein
MIGLDTNVIVRYVMQDDAKQSQKAARLIEALSVEAPGFVPLVTMVEFVWVLTSCYDLKRQQVAQAIDGILRTKEFVVDRTEQIAQALRVYKSGIADFADCLIERGAAGAGCDETMTFDVSAAKSAGMTLIP